jgi:hypothetical protein
VAAYAYVCIHTLKQVLVVQRWKTTELVQLHHLTFKSAKCTQKIKACSVKNSKDIKYHHNIVATPRAISFLSLSKFHSYDPGGPAPEIVIWITWHPWWISYGDGRVPRVTKGPFYNISSERFERVAALPNPRFFIIENRVLAISLAPYLNFDENTVYEMDDVNGLVIYERRFLEQIGLIAKL